MVYANISRTDQTFLLNSEKTCFHSRALRQRPSPFVAPPSRLLVTVRTYGLIVLASCSVVPVPLGTLCGGTGDPLLDPDGLQVGLSWSEVGGDGGLLLDPAVGHREEPVEGAEPVEEDRRSGRF